MELRKTQTRDHPLICIVVFLPSIFVSVDRGVTSRQSLESSLYGPEMNLHGLDRDMLSPRKSLHSPGRSLYSRERPESLRSSSQGRPQSEALVWFSIFDITCLF